MTLEFDEFIDMFAADRPTDATWDYALPVMLAGKKTDARPVSLTEGFPVRTILPCSLYLSSPFSLVPSTCSHHCSVLPLLVLEHWPLDTGFCPIHYKS